MEEAKIIGATTLEPDMSNREFEVTSEITERQYAAFQ